MAFFEIFLSVGAYHKKKIAQRGGVRPTAANLLPCFASVMFCIVRHRSAVRGARNRQKTATVAPTLLTDLMCCATSIRVWRDKLSSEGGVAQRFAV